MFDLYNTLVPGGTRAQRDQVSRKMADVLGVEREPFAVLIRRTFDDRTRGRLGDLTETVRYLARHLGGDPHVDAVNAAVEFRLALTRTLHDATWAVGTLDEIGRSGILRGLVSDCSAETPMIWSQSPLSAHFEAVSFSCVTGHRKPEPEAYLTATRELAVGPGDCAFVGDGSSNELTGAAELGMDVYRFRPAGRDLGDSIDEDRAWTGPTLTDLKYLLTAMSD